MKQVLFIVRLFLFWMIFFLFQQIIFIATGFASPHGDVNEMLISLWKGGHLNMATSCYLITLPALLVLSGSFGLSAGIINRLTTYLTYLFITLCSILLCSDISLFNVWGTKINSKALEYLQYPKELMPTIFNSQNAFLFVLIAIQIAAGVWFYKKISKLYAHEKQPVYLSVLLFIFVPALLVVGYRGGLQKVPMNRNWVFYSPHPLLNYGALNSFWNTVELISNPIDNQVNPYTFFDPEEARQITLQMHAAGTDSTTHILHTTKPNIVIIFLESWAADVIGCLGEEKNVTPKFCELANEGLLFTRFYSTGYRTEQGFLATLSSTPAIPVGSVIHTFGKFDKLPNLYKVFNAEGYHTSFYTGGRLFFDNIEAYLRSAGVKTMKGENEWSFKRRTVWGAYDDETFAMHLNELNQMPAPFFSAMSTMTTHEWFDADVPKLFKGDGEVNDGYRNTMHYSDSCLYAYLQEAKKQSWYKNTLFILVADHACRFPLGRANYEKERHHIPMLFTGGALAKQWKGKQINTIGTHTDIAATLLSQLNLNATDFKYSKNLFNSGTNKFAYYAFDNGFGFITSQCDVIYDHNQNKMTSSNCNDSSTMHSLLKQGKAYLQTQFQDNLDVVTQKRK